MKTCFTNDIGAASLTFCGYMYMYMYNDEQRALPCVALTCTCTCTYNCCSIKDYACTHAFIHALIIITLYMLLQVVTSFTNLYSYTVPSSGYGAGKGFLGASTGFNI